LSLNPSPTKERKREGEGEGERGGETTNTNHRKGGQLFSISPFSHEVFTRLLLMPGDVLRAGPGNTKVPAFEDQRGQRKEEA
jgi:hypothetical protein